MSLLNRSIHLHQTDINAATPNVTDKEHSASATLAIVSFISFVAFFDFTVLVFMEDVFSSVFFPSQNTAFFNQLLLILLIASGFLLRPIGALMIGRYGDKHGRKAALNINITLFLLITLIATILPSYAQVGITAFICLVVVRLLQGAIFGGYLTLGFIYIAESVAKQRVATSLALNMAAILLGAVACASLSYTFKYLLTTEQLLIYGWRLMFAASSILSICALMLVRRLDETPLFIRAKSLSSQQSPAPPLPIVYADGTTHSALPPHKRPGTQPAKVNRFNAIFLSVVLTLVVSSLVTTVAVFLPKLLLLKFSVDTDLLYTAHVIGMFGLMLGLIVYGWLNDKIGASNVLMLGSVILAIVVVMFYYYCLHSDMADIIPFYGILGFACGLISVCISILIRLFPIQHRMTMAGVIYNLMTAVTGIALPFGLLYLTNLVTLMPALYIIFICICAFMIGYYMSQSPNISELEKQPQ